MIQRMRCIEKLGEPLLKEVRAHAQRPAHP